MILADVPPACSLWLYAPPPSGCLPLYLCLSWPLRKLPCTYFLGVADVGHIMLPRVRVPWWREVERSVAPGLARLRLCQGLKPLVVDQSPAGWAAKPIKLTGASRPTWPAVPDGEPKERRGSWKGRERWWKKRREEMKGWNKAGSKEKCKECWRKLGGK